MTGTHGSPSPTTLLPPDPLRQACQAAQARYQLFPGAGAVTAPHIVVVAVSGGADSVALLDVLHSLQAAWALQLHIAHIDHNLRPESAADAAFVARLAEQQQLPFHQRQLSPTVLASSPEGVEAAARHARYRFLVEVALTVTPPTQTPVIALAHHADDQAETVLLHLVRGSGLQGLGGMRWVSVRRIGDLWADAPPERREQAVRLVRPFLGVQRADLLRYLRNHDLTWREDSSNTDQRFVRNRVRHTILPQFTAINPNVVQTLARTAQILQAEADRLTELDRTALVTVLLEPAWSLAKLQRWHGQSNAQRMVTSPVRVVLDIGRLATLTVAAQRGLLREALALLAAPASAPPFAQIETLLTAIEPPCHASGPHPLLADLAWSLTSASATIPARLSLHQTHALPFAPTHPFLDEPWRKAVGWLPLPDEGRVRVDDQWSLVVTRTTLQALPATWRSQLDLWQAVLDATQLGQPVLTTPRPGDVFAPLGMDGHHKTLGDFFTDRKVPTALRPGWPIIVDQSSGATLWVCGHQPSHCARITEKTQVVLRLAWTLNDARSE